MAEEKHSKQQNKTRKKQAGTAGRKSSAARRKKRTGKRKMDRRQMTVALVLVGIAIAVTLFLLSLGGRLSTIMESFPFSGKTDSELTGAEQDEMDVNDDGRPPLDVQLLTPNSYSRPQIALNEINGIVIHYTANPGADAQANRDYFESLKDNGITYASSHFVIGLEGEIIQCIPSSEIAYASNERNHDTLSIECCHADESGALNDATYQSLVELTAWLCRHFEISPDNVIRHYDVSGKICPKYFVEHEDAWNTFLDEVRAAV